MQVMQCGADVVPCGGECGASMASSGVGRQGQVELGGHQLIPGGREGALGWPARLQGTRWPPGSLTHQHLSRPHKACPRPSLT